MEVIINTKPRALRVAGRMEPGEVGVANGNLYMMVDGCLPILDTGECVMVNLRTGRLSRFVRVAELAVATVTCKAEVL
jgi:hypothetical protein